MYFFACIPTSPNHLAPNHPLMCFASTKTLRSLRECRRKHLEDLGFNLDDTCDYLEYNSAIMRVIEYNIRGVKSKQDKLESFIKDLKYPEIIILCETWLTETNPTITIPGYSFSEKHRPNKKGGGAGTLVRDNLIYREVPVINSTKHNPNFEYHFKMVIF